MVRRCGEARQGAEDHPARPPPHLRIDSNQLRCQRVGVCRGCWGTRQRTSPWTPTQTCSTPISMRSLQRVTLGQSQVRRGSVISANQSGWRDSNPRPLRPERSTLPSCATPRVKPRQRIAPAGCEAKRLTAGSRGVNGCQAGFPAAPPVARGTRPRSPRPWRRRPAACARLRGPWTRRAKKTMPTITSVQNVSGKSRNHGIPVVVGEAACRARRGKWLQLG